MAGGCTTTQLLGKCKRLVTRKPDPRGIDGSGEPLIPYYKNMCSADSISVSSSPGVKENLFICSLYMQSCDQIARGDRSRCCFYKDVIIA